MTGFSQPERHGLERMQVPKPASHPGADLLTAFAEHSLLAREQEEVLAHLATCANCREVVALAGAPLVEAVPEPVRKRGLWELPLFRWGAVAATAVVVVGAVTIGVYDRPAAHLEVMTKEALPQSISADQVSSVPTSKPDLRSQDAAKFAPPAQERRAVHLQQQVRFERPGSAAPDLKAKKQAQLGGMSLGGPVLASPKDASGGASAANTYSMSIPTAPPPPPARDANAASIDKAFIVSQNAPLAARNVGALADVQGGAVAGQKTEMKTSAPAAKPQSSAPQSAVNSYAADESAFAANQTVEVTAAAPAVAPPTPSQQSAVLDKMQTNRARAMFHEVRPIESNITGTEWQITREGELQRSFSRGSLWETMLKGKQFRSVAVVRDHIWAGGDDGALYYSSDNGRNWNPMAIRDTNVTVTGSVVRLRFDDQRNGSLETSTGETWKTNDGGQTWHKQH